MTDLLTTGDFTLLLTPHKQALFADSVEPGERSRVFTIKYALTQLASAMGPMGSIVMFHYLGNEWEVAQCQHVIIAGLLLCLLPSALCYLFDDDKAHLSHSPQSVERRRREHEERLMIARQASAGNDDAPAKALIVPLLAPASEAAPDAAGMLEREQGQERPAGSSRCCCLRRPAGDGFCATYYTPTVIVATDIAFALASGMSIKYFSIMFMEDYGLSPIMVSWIYVLCPIFTSLSSFASQHASRRLGRVSTTIGFKFAGVSLLFLMCYLDYTKATAALVVPVFVARTALMNGTKALTRSIVMDSVPKEARAKWNSLESVTGATWAGSAVIGGLLVDRYGFLLNNLATAALQFVSTLPLFLVLGLVPTEHTTPTGGLLFDDLMGTVKAGGASDEEEEEEALSRSMARQALFAPLVDDECQAAEDLETAIIAERLEEARRVVGKADPALDAPLEEERDLGLLERILKGVGVGVGAGGGYRSRAATIEESRGLC